MAVLKVRRYGDPLLRRRAREIETVTPDIRRLVEDMIDTMYDEVGIGLAAPQVGTSVRLMVVADEEGRGAQSLVNPVISEQGGSVTAEEGCLSLPGIYAQVTRAQWVKLDAQDLEGRPVTITARGLRARVFQHEIDHLDGVLFIDRLEPVVRDRIKRRIKKEGFSEDAAAHRAFAL